MLDPIIKLLSSMQSQSLAWLRTEIHLCGLGIHRVPQTSTPSALQPNSPIKPLESLFMQFPLTHPAQSALPRLKWGILKSLFPAEKEVEA